MHRTLLFFLIYLAAAAFLVNHFWGTENGKTVLAFALPALGALMLVAVHYINIGRQIRAADHLEDKKLDNARKLEREKSSRDSNKRLAAAAGEFYHALAELESGIYNAEKVVAAEDAVKKVDGNLSAATKTEWYAFWQAGRNIHDLVKRGSPSQQEWQAIWSDQYVHFGQKYKELCDALDRA